MQGILWRVPLSPCDLATRNSQPGGNGPLTRGGPVNPRLKSVPKTTLIVVFEQERLCSYSVGSKAYNVKVQDLAFRPLDLGMVYIPWRSFVGRDGGFPRGHLLAAPRVPNPKPLSRALFTGKRMAWAEVPLAGRIGNKDLRVEGEDPEARRFCWPDVQAFTIWSPLSASALSAFSPR